MNVMTEKLVTLWPEMVLLAGACVCLMVGLSSSAWLRRSPVWVAGLSLLLAGWLVWPSPDHAAPSPHLDLAWLGGVVGFIKLAIVGVGLLLLLIVAQVPDHLLQTRDADERDRRGRPFEPGNAVRGEFFAFFLFSLTGAMLCAGAQDLVWLFLSLELTSLPTYVMVATCRDRADAQESAVKYFFLGALAAAVFLYGFALMYGATGSTQYADIAAYIHGLISTGQALPSLFVAGLVMAVVGISFKIAAVPMHFYAADVYQGAASPVAAFLAFVPKTAGFVSLIGLLRLTGGSPGELFGPVLWLLWGMAVVSMTVGNVLGLLQDNVKRVLAYSSIAHTGYMLVGLVAAWSAMGNLVTADPSQPLGNGVAALLFYLVAYGLATLGAFAVLGCLSRNGEEAQTFDDIAGLGRRHPVLGAIMLLSVLSLLGLPPMVGFLGKIYLFGSAVHHGYVWLVVIAVLNSAVSGAYYLRIVAACYFGAPQDESQTLAVPARRLGAAIAAIGAVALGFAGSRLVDAARTAATPPTQTADALPHPDTGWTDHTVKW